MIFRGAFGKGRFQSGNGKSGVSHRQVEADDPTYSDVRLFVAGIAV